MVGTFCGTCTVTDYPYYYYYDYFLLIMVRILVKLAFLSAGLLLERRAHVRQSVQLQSSYFPPCHSRPLVPLVRCHT